MKKLKQFTISLLTILIGFTAIYVPYKVFAEDDKYDGAYLNTALPFSIIKSSYHETMNDYFNDKLNILGEVLENPEFYKDERFIAPKDADIENYKVQCGEQNVSTFCVSMGALEIYNKYINALAELKEEIPEREDESQVISLDRLFLLTSQRDASIGKEIIDGEKVLMATVSAYNEYRIAYPIHIKNQEIIKSLTKYKRALIYLRRNVELLPSKFIDASSAYCE